MRPGIAIEEKKKKQFGRFITGGKYRLVLRASASSSSKHSARGVKSSIYMLQQAQSNGVARTSFSTEPYPGIGELQAANAKPDAKCLKAFIWS